MKKETKRLKGHYIDKIIDLFPELQSCTIHSHVCKNKTTYKEFYEDLKERLEILDKAQNTFADVRPRDLKELPEFKNCNPTRKNEFLRTVYVFRDSIPSKRFIERVKKILDEWESLPEICRNCKYYNNELAFCNYLDTHTRESFNCVAFKKENK